jgi:RNA polymerase sigma-70 factor (ECF subfamily)
LISGIRESDPEARRKALETLCSQYWKPVYAYLRQVERLEPAAAEDRAQEFFAHLLKYETLPKADPSVARFRTFLKAVLRNFLSLERRREGAQKRGGGEKPLRIDAGPLESDLGLDLPSKGESAEELLDRQWALQILRLAREELFRQLTSAGRLTDLEVFRAYTTDDEASRPTYADLAKKLGISDWDVWKRLSTVRDELRLWMKAEVAETVQDPKDVEEELKIVLSCLS